MDIVHPRGETRLQLSWKAAVLCILVLAITYVTFKAGIDYSANLIWTTPEYGHGLVIPLVAAFLIWQRRDQLDQLPFEGSWWGVLFLLLGVTLGLVGTLSSLFVIQQYSCVIAFYGLVLAMVGWRVFRRISAPLLILLFMVPLPNFLYNNLSSQLQLISSQIGVWFIRIFGISVYLEGNVIDLGAYKLQVAEACNGLRYLFPLMTLGFLVAYFFKASMWKRVVLFLSSIPITILMNSFRIGMIGVMVEHWGVGMAEGFLHEFQGWAVFMTSVGIMLLEMMLLARIRRDAMPWRAQFGLEFPPRPFVRPRVEIRGIPATFYVAAGLLVVSAATTLTLPERAEVVPTRSVFSDFPLNIGPWHGRSEPLEAVYLDALMLDDYLLANFSRPAERPVNFYVAWYDSQRAGRSAHSPRSCLPGGGWVIHSLTQIDVPGLVIDGVPVRANRVLIQLGAQKQLVYYWFQQRGRVVTNEYLVKWYMFWDSLTRNRTDGALVRFTMPLSATESEEEADRALTEFAAAAIVPLDAFVPG